VGDRCVVRRDTSENVSEGGIVLPDDAQQKADRGTVLTVGPGLVTPNGDRVGMEVQAGDTVIFGEYSGATVQIDGEELVILREAEVLVILGRGENVEVGVDANSRA